MNDSFIFGWHAVEAALQEGRVKTIWLEQKRKDARVQQLLAQHEAVIRLVSKEELDKISNGARHQGIIADAELPQPQNEQALWQLLDGLKQAPFLLILDGVQDPHNLGACLRSAAGAGVHAVIVPEHRAVGLTATVCKVACGAAAFLPFISVVNLKRTLDELKQRGIWLVGMDGEGEQSLYQLDLCGPLAIMLGAEAKGMRRIHRETCDFVAQIPLHPQMESLNVSVATGVSLFEAVRQRGVTP